MRIETLNIIWFQAAWWTIVLSASQNTPLLMVTGTLLALLLHFRFISTNKKRDLFVLSSCAMLGITGDFLLIQGGVFQLPEAFEFFPAWLVCLWTLFPLTLPYSLRPLISKTLLLPLLGSAAGFSYYAGTFFNILITPAPVIPHLLVASTVWTINLYLFRNSLKKIDRRLTLS